MIESHNWRLKFGQKGWLRPTLLKILGNGNFTGMEMMNEIQEMSHGWWKPSPGSVYPLLETMKKEGIIKKLSNGKYALTSKYRKVTGDAEDIDDAITNIEGNIAYLEEAENNTNIEAQFTKRMDAAARRLKKLAEEKRKEIHKQ
ncbi:MAG: PadR family transcriptional regulator [Candidatus Marsarchaeota archaeon]|jgi:DNA-binding PadR family transcriptional regulator|nr:PadR family transcriptional regulator [Candidatus Marsarchaeota archaeon]